jgi:phage FluMu gp28-like protein
MVIKTHADIESEAGLSRYLIPLQVERVLCQARYQYDEKCNRCGWSWIMALADVRTRLMMPGRDCLFTTQNWNGAVEFGRYIDQWIGVFGRGKNVISRSEEWITVQHDDPKGGKIAVQEKVGIYKFDGGSRIILFSSSPWAIQTFEGDVRWDEAAFHEHQEQMHAALATRIQFGFNYAVWSAHNGMNSWFNQVLGKIARAPGSGWTCRKITIYDVIEQGLVEKINARSGMNMTREEFLEDCRRRALTPAIFAERFECNPADSGSSIVPWGVIEGRRDQTIARVHVSDDWIKQEFGRADEGRERRVSLMRQWLASRFSGVLSKPAHYRIGFDVAASGKGDLASFWIDQKIGERYEQRALLTSQTEDWHFLKTALYFFLDMPGMKGAGDSTGIGKQITWEASQDYSGRFIGVPFTVGSKSRMGTRIMTQLQNGDRRLALGHDDAAMDVYSVQKTAQGSQITFTTTANPLNAASHGDMFWSAALSSEIDVEGLPDALPPRPLPPSSGQAWGQDARRSAARHFRGLVG